jgi:hypothetical protein
MTSEVVPIKTVRNQKTTSEVVLVRELMMNVPVLIVGAGSTGLCASILLSRLGVPSLVVERQWPLVGHPGLPRQAAIRFGTELVSIEQDVEGVSASVVTLSTGVLSRVRASYVVAADGAASSIRSALGIGMVGVDVGLGAQMADRFRDRRIFLAGAAAHRVTAAGGFAMNSGIQDVHNLAWKLAATIGGWGDAALLETYEAERRPVSERHFMHVLRMEGDVSSALTDLVAPYESSAVVADGPATRPVPADETAPAFPGCRAPHVWIEHLGRTLSTLDLIGGRFVLLTGDSPAGQGWAACAWSAARELKVPFAAFTIGSADGASNLATGAQTRRLEGWHTAYGIDRDGAVLVRPDGYVGWRSRRAVPNPIRTVMDALSRILSREGTAALRAAS